ncbi:MAG: hypothetical protein GXX84_09720 [Acidobacteria bacterium]|nr:hypothetical protein [Acidobacteriota bacterium]
MNLQIWLENLCRYETLAQLKRSDFYLESGPSIEAFLAAPQIRAFPGATPRLESFLRVVQWNIEKGKQFARILEKLQTHSVLKWADVVILNEADCGMIRSGNRDIARELAENLGMHVAFAPAHFELTKGTDGERDLAGENCESLQGNAVLTRYPIVEACTVPLPVSFEPYEFHEKRFGRRNCLWAKIRLRKGSLWVGSVHLELRNTPRCRAAQVRHIMEHLPGSDGDRYVLGGDLNTNSFGRGSSFRTLRSILRLLRTPSARMKKMLLHPESGREPLFEILKQCGFTWEDLNSSGETARAALNSLEEAVFLPKSLASLVQRRLAPYQGYLCFKLDWLLGKNIVSVPDGTSDRRAQIPALKPAVVEGVNFGPDRISDHLPIFADIGVGGLDSSEPEICEGAVAVG